MPLFFASGFWLPPIFCFSWVLKGNISWKWHKEIKNFKYYLTYVLAFPVPGYSYFGEDVLEDTLSGGNLTFSASVISEKNKVKLIKFCLMQEFVLQALL